MKNEVCEAMTIKMVSYDCAAICNEINSQSLIAINGYKYVFYGSIYLLNDSVNFSNRNKNMLRILFVIYRMFISFIYIRLIFLNFAQIAFK